MPTTSAMTTPRTTNHKAGSTPRLWANAGPPIMAVTTGEKTRNAMMPAASARSTGTRTPIRRRTPNTNSTSASAVPAASSGQYTADMARSGRRPLQQDHRRCSRLHPAESLKRAGHPPPLGGVAVEVAFELDGVERPAEHLVFHVLSFV